MKLRFLGTEWLTAAVVAALLSGCGSTTSSAPAAQATAVGTIGVGGASTPGGSTPGGTVPIASAPGQTASVVVATSAPGVDCSAPPVVPAQLAQGATTLHLVQSACAIGISGVDLKLSSSTTRSVIFTPPMTAGGMDPASATTDWTSSGQFEGLSALHSTVGDATLDATGTYQATAHMELRLHVGGADGEYASGATASSKKGTPNQYNNDAARATGNPNNPKYGDKLTAWAPAVMDGGLEWLELTYETALIPAGVRVWENDGNGFVTRIEAMDDAAATWTTLWSGADPTPPGAVAAFSPPLQAPNFATTRIRLTVDTSVPDWNEVDAVELLGPEQPAGWVLWVRGGWQEEGAVSQCMSGACVTAPWTNQPVREWMWAINTATGKVGQTPDQVQ